MKETKEWLRNQKDLRMISFVEEMKSSEINVFDLWIHLGHVVFKDMDLKGIETFEKNLKKGTKTKKK